MSQGRSIWLTFSVLCSEVLYGETLPQGNEMRCRGQILPSLVEVAEKLAVGFQNLESLAVLCFWQVTVTDRVGHDCCEV